ncbi:hypothetical protein [Streptomyces sp. Rer75]|uniref:hypothetical protein n=1 Tax=unclassified Streptomyces TaxID=2593676 RepID=UPI00211E4058|nr:hypothetical protein [Streptomyces sp. Rer75]
MTPAPVDTVGVVGAGAVGQTVAVALVPSGMTAAANAPVIRTLTPFLRGYAGTVLVVTTPST